MSWTMEIKMRLNPEDEGRDRALSFHFDTPDTLPLPSTWPRRRRNAARSIVADLRLGYHANPEIWTSYSRRQMYYSTHAHPLATYRAVVPTIDWLAGQGFIENRPQAPGIRGRQSIMRAGPRLIEDLNPQDVTLGNVAPPLRIRDDNDNLIPVPRNRATTAMERALAEINEAIEAACVEIANDCPTVTRDGPVLRFDPAPGKQSGAVVTPLRTRLYRSFNNDLRHGGRFFGHWPLGVPGKSRNDRRWLLIDGEPTSEPDYSALHARLLYALIDKPFQIGSDGKLTPGSDPYTVAGWERSLAKVAFQVMLNAVTCAFRRKLGTDSNSRWAPIPIQGGHGFQLMLGAHSTG